MSLIKGWVGGQGMGGGGGGWASQRWALPVIDRGAVFPADDRNVHKPPDRPRWPLAAVWHTTNSD